MRFYFHEDAETEFDRAVEYYEDCRHGLGVEFAQEVYATIDRIIQHPDAWSPMSKDFMLCSTACARSFQAPIFNLQFLLRYSLM